MRYRRTKQPGGTFFFTVNLANRSNRTLVDNIDALRNVMRIVRKAHPFETVAIVVLPDHTHCVWNLPKGDGDYSMRWALIKAGFSRSLPANEWLNSSRFQKRERGIWQRRFWEHQIRDEQDLSRHIDYIHYNPVKHGHALQPTDWPHSSIHRYIRSGLLSGEWTSRTNFAESEFGEP